MQTKSVKTMMIRILAILVSVVSIVCAVPVCPDDHSCCEQVKQTCCTQSGRSNVPISPPSGTECSCVDHGTQVVSLKDVAREKKRQVRNFSTQVVNFRQASNPASLNCVAALTNVSAPNSYTVAVFRLTVRWRC